MGKRSGMNAHSLANCGQGEKDGSIWRIPIIERAFDSEGTFENSQPFQRRVGVIKIVQVPEGRQSFLLFGKDFLPSRRDSFAIRFDSRH
jgi:hypothetical protein